MNFLREPAARELQQFRMFLRTQHARALSTGSTRELVINPRTNEAKIRIPDDDSTKQFAFTYWRPDHEELVRFRLTPSGVFGSQPLRVIHAGSIRKFTVDRIRGLGSEKDQS